MVMIILSLERKRWQIDTNVNNNNGKEINHGNYHDNDHPDE